MAIDLIISLPTADIPVDLPPGTNPNPMMVYNRDATDFTAYLSQAAIGAWPGSAILIQAWDTNQARGKGYLQRGQSYGIGDVVEGTPDQPLHPDYFAFIRPLGNQSGVATGFLDTVRWQGHPEAKFTNDDNRYQTSDMPFDLKFTRENIGADAPVWSSIVPYFTGDYVQSPLGTTWQASQDSLDETPFGGSPFWDFINSPGWGWRAEIMSEDPLRDIQARAIAIYSDPAWTAFVYTSGAFTLDGGTGLYTSVTPDGQRTATPDPVYYSLLWGSLQEGNWQLINQNEGGFETREHWFLDQGSSAESAVIADNGGAVQTADGGQFTSPDGHVITEIVSDGSNRLVMRLAGDAQDTLDPTITVFLPAGAEVIAFSWNMGMSAYRSGSVAGIRDDILANTGFKMAFSLTWA